MAKHFFSLRNFFNNLYIQHTPKADSPWTLKSPQRDHKTIQTRLPHEPKTVQTELKRTHNDSQIDAETVGMIPKITSRSSNVHHLPSS